MELWVVRHGETFGNVEKVIQGHQGGELTEKGIAQAKLLGIRLSNIKFQHIYVSDLNRTKQTASYVISYHKDTPVTYDARIREKCGGILEGKPLTYIKELAISKNIPIRKFKPKKGECWNDVHQRAKLFLDELIVKNIREDYLDLNLKQENERINTEKSELNSKIKNLTKDIENNNAMILANDDNNLDNKIVNISNFKSLNDNKNSLEKIVINLEDVQPLHVKINSLEIDDLKDKDNNINNTQNKISTDVASTKTVKKPYCGYTENFDVNRILIVTHGGFITELVNVIRSKQGLDFLGKDMNTNTAVSVIKIYCSRCGGACQNGNSCSQSRIEFDFLLYNDNSHCKDLIDNLNDK